MLITAEAVPKRACILKEDGKKRTSDVDYVNLFYCFFLIDAILHLVNCLKDIVSKFSPGLLAKLTCLLNKILNEQTIEKE